LQQRRAAEYGIRFQERQSVATRKRQEDNNVQREKVLSTAIRRQQSAEDFFGKDLTQLEAEQMQKWLD
jgi:hypothetical protein